MTLDAENKTFAGYGFLSDVQSARDFNIRVFSEENDFPRPPALWDGLRRLGA